VESRNDVDDHSDENGDVNSWEAGSNGDEDSDEEGDEDSRQCG
jgi:hypothetical protein